MFELDNIFTLLLAQSEEIEYSQTRYILYGLAGVVGLAIIWFIARSITLRQTYDLTGSYGGPGMRRVYRHKRLKSFDREGEIRGKAQSFKDPELEQLLSEDKLSEAARYLTGVLNAAKESGDDYTRIRYARYSEEIIGRYDKLEDTERGGKAIHVKK